MIFRMLVTMTLLALAGCTTMTTGERPPAYYETLDNEDQAVSLFPGDETLLGDEEIGRILEYRYQAPAQSRIALIAIGADGWSRWSEEMSRTSLGIRDEVVARLLASPRVYDVSYLPTILVPAEKSVPRLREAAARYQADLLLAYRTDCHSFERYRLFAADLGRAYCKVEAVLLDTRTGLVPFTSVANHTFEAIPSESDLNFRETMMRAELEAIAAGLGEVSRDIVDFLARP